MQERGFSTEKMLKDIQNLAAEMMEVRETNYLPEKRHERKILYSTTGYKAVEVYEMEKSSKSRSASRRGVDKGFSKSVSCWRDRGCLPLWTKRRSDFGNFEQLKRHDKIR